MVRPTQQLADEWLASGNLERALFAYPRHERIPRLHAWVSSQRVAVDDRLRRLIAVAWTETELPHLQGRLPLELFTLVGYCSDNTVELPEEVEVWRGVAGEYPLGISWTRSQAIATNFAYRFATAGNELFLQRGVVSRTGVLGYFIDRDEAEVILDPARLAATETTKLVVHPAP